MGRLKKGVLPAGKIPKSKKIKLSHTQKQYAKMIHSIEADLTKKQTCIEMLNKKLATWTAELKRLNDERGNLEGAKKNLEGILNQIPPPPAWNTYVTHVYEYHHYHLHHHDHTACGSCCPWHHPVYVGPWWQYYYGGNYISYPTQSQLTYTSGVNFGEVNGGGSLGGAFSGGSMGTTLTTTSNVDVTLTPALPTSGVMCSGNVENNNMFFTHNSNLPSINSVSLASASFCAPTIAPGVSFIGGAPPVEYAKSDASVADSVTALQSYGFFDKGVPAVDAGDLSVLDLVKTAAK